MATQQCSYGTLERSPWWSGVGLWLLGANRHQRRQERSQAALGRWYCPACEEWLDQPRHWDPEAFDSSLHKLKWYPDDGSMGRPPRPGDSYCNDCAVWVLEGEPHPLGHDLELWRAWGSLPRPATPAHNGTYMGATSGHTPSRLRAGVTTRFVVYRVVCCRRRPCCVVVDTSVSTTYPSE